jgi:uncharacterized membrane protein YeaQ/YmgE (transglycosylase-associated protein family)
MLEILLIIFLSKKIGRIAASKGRSQAGYIVLFVLLWVGGEFAGALYGAIQDEEGFLAYVYALAGAAAGAILAFIIVNALPDRRQDFVPDPAAFSRLMGGEGLRPFGDQEDLSGRDRDGITDRPEESPRRADDHIRE